MVPIAFCTHQRGLRLLQVGLPKHTGASSRIEPRQALSVSSSATQTAPLPSSADASVPASTTTADATSDPLPTTPKRTYATAVSQVSLSSPSPQRDRAAGRQWHNKNHTQQNHYHPRRQKRKQRLCLRLYSITSGGNVDVVGE